MSDTSDIKLITDSVSRGHYVFINESPSYDEDLVRISCKISRNMLKLCIRLAKISDETRSLFKFKLHTCLMP